MPRLLVGNFDFEHHLAAPRAYQPSATVRRLNEEMSALWAVAADDGDVIWTPAAIDPVFFEELATHGFAQVEAADDETAIEPPVQVCPWGWTENVRRWATKYGWSIDAPPQAAVRQVNSRAFSWQCEQQWKVGLPGAMTIPSIDELRAHLQKLPKFIERWVLKAEFSMSARERILGQGRQLSQEIANWMRRRLQQNGIVFFEPWVDRLEEAGLQFTIDKQRRVRFEGLTPLLTDAAGTYRGSRFGPEADSLPQWQPAIEDGLRVAQRAAEFGYWGPLGIDAVRYRDPDGKVRLRPIQDVNARQTMGRLSLGLRRLLTPGQTGSWLHVRRPNEAADAAGDWPADCAAHFPEDLRWISTSPRDVGGRAAKYLTVVLIASGLESLCAAEEATLRCESRGG